MAIDDTYDGDGQMISIPLPVGSKVTLLSDVSVEENAEGSSGIVTFEDYVSRYSSDTMLLEFEEADVGLQEFSDMVREAESIEVIRNP